MNAPRTIPADVLRLQLEASDPTGSAWVAANAGSGKTYVLAQRVIRLLLDGVSPQKILCLTFTKAAAANMANRVFETLAKWISLDDAALDKAIEQLEGKPPGARRRALARRLFAEAIETPGGLKVQTIHAFCTRLLHQFPFEADVAARFTVLEERAERDLLNRLRLQVLLEGADAPDSALGRALGAIMQSASDQSFADTIDEAIAERDPLARWIGHAGSIAAAMAELSGMLDITPDETLGGIETALMQSPYLAKKDWPRIAAVLADGLKTDREQAERFVLAGQAPAPIATETYLDIFLTEKRGPRKRLVTKSIEANDPDLVHRLGLEQERLAALIARRRAVATRERTAALLTIAEAILKRYAAEKNKRGLLDYDDLIEKTSKLMDSVDAAWVHYKLDLGIDHILVDEAQDTSPKQWAIIKKLASEFTAGAGARGPARRTVFAVGDEKQSIFSFQGAVPTEFANMRRHFESGHRNAELDFRYRQFKLSFRSGANVLGAVDAVFHNRNVYASVTTDEGGIPPHQALPEAPPGLVELWPLIEAESAPPIEGWDAPFDDVSVTSPQVRLAEKIASTISALKKKGYKAGDFLILVRQRGLLFETIIRAIKNAGIAVAGADRLVLTEHIAIMDLMVLADALLTPQDDLALATILKSPLFGLDDDQIFELAYQRQGSLRDSLRTKAQSDPRCATLDAELDRLAARARCERPFAFYAELLGPNHGRRKILARLGAEASDALDEFLNLALDYEARETPSLQGFVAWLRGAAVEIKRDMDIVRDEVRVMTVHGAKGLEAPIVILADTTTRPTGPGDPRLLLLPAQNAPPGTPDRLVWAGRKEDDVAPVAAAREKGRDEARDEYRRLLYVAMTRAADRLIVCGTQGVKVRPEGCWYDLVSTALATDAVEETADGETGVVLRWRQTPQSSIEVPTEPKSEPAKSVVPVWLRQDAPAPAARSRIIAPSTAVEGRPFRSFETAEAERKALIRGRLVHRLMQALPDIPRERRDEAARRHLAYAQSDIGEDEREAILTEVFAVLDDPRFAPLFTAESRAEVPIIGRLRRQQGEPLAVSGQIDRLIVTMNEVFIADYKTNRPMPRHVSEVSKAYVTQLGLYRAVLQQLYSGRAVRAALVWTAGPELMEIPATELDFAVAALL
ncbi:MAG TPA: double-strand break repair helicase AddA [Xanthobacteraceae bacterium]|nr:double-strand break repair helicase AddA [Xanthobacteraceae bacterium]